MAGRVSSENIGASVRNIFWAYASFFSTKVLNLISIVVLAWYLEPADFGLMAICLAVIAYFEIISQFGMGAALISARGRIEETASAVLLCGFAFSAALCALIWLTAAPLAAWYGDPRLAELLPIIAAALVIRALTTVNSSFLYKELRLKAKVVPDVARGLAKGGVAIALALLGYGVWALVAGYLAGAIAGTLATWAVRPWLPRRRPSLADFRRILGFGVHLIGAQTINSTPRLLDNLLIGKVLGMQALGIYSLAFRIPELGIRTFSNVAGTVLHPVMSRIQSDPGELRAYYYGALKYCALLMFGTGAMIAVLAAPLVHTLYAPKWHGMIAPMQLLAIAFAIGTANMVPGNLFKALSRADLMFKVSLINLPFFVLLIWAAVPYGITAVAWAQLALSVIRFLPNYLFLRRVMEISVRDTFAALAPGIACAGVAAAAGLAAQGPVFAESPAARLFWGAAAFLAAYLLSVRIAAPEVFRLLFKRLRRRRGRAGQA